MKLIYHPISPYSRKVYMVALEHGLADRITLEKVVVAPIPYTGWSDDNDSVAKSNPLAKIPTLVAGVEDGLDAELGLFDSRVICEFLESHPQRKTRASDETHTTNTTTTATTTTWLSKTIHACADGMLDAEVLVVYEEKIRRERGLEFPTWIAGQREKIARGFDFLERQAAATAAGEGALRLREPAQDVSMAEIAVAAAVAFLDARHVPWQVGRPALAAFVERWKDRPSFFGTDARVDWKVGGRVEDLGFKAFEYPK